MKFFKDPWFLTSAALVLILGFSMFTFGSGSEGSSSSENSSSSSSSSVGAKPVKIEGLEISPEPFDFGEVSMKKGIVEKTFSLKNKSGKKIEVAQIETSCMCTEAAMKVGEKVSPYFGMPGHAGNSGWQATISPDGEAQVTAKFDPNAHGPDATGRIDRVVRIYFSDPPNTYADINFSADVIK